METIPPYILDTVIFMAIFYLGLTKPSGEFFKKYIFQYKNLILPTIATMLIVFAVAIAMNFDLYIAIILVFALLLFHFQQILFHFNFCEKIIL